MATPLASVPVDQTAVKAAVRLPQVHLLDEQRNPFTRQREAQIREEMRAYDRQKNPVG